MHNEIVIRMCRERFCRRLYYRENPTPVDGDYLMVCWMLPLLEHLKKPLRSTLIRTMDVNGQGCVHA